MTMNYPALKEFGEALRVSGVDPYECFNVATAILGMAHEKEWLTNPERMAAWLQELALEVGRHWHEHEPAVFEEELFPPPKPPRESSSTTSEGRGPAAILKERAKAFQTEPTSRSSPQSESRGSQPRYVATY